MTTAIGLLLLVRISAQAIDVGPSSHALMRLQHTVSTRTARVGDPVHLRTVHPFTTGTQSIPIGSHALGVVLRCDRPGRVRGRAALEIGVVSITQPDGTVLPVTGRSPVLEPPQRIRSPMVRDPRPVVPIVAGMTAMYGSAWLVSHASDSEDTIVGSGAVVGLATGVLVGVLKRGDDLVLDAGTTIGVTF